MANVPPSPFSSPHPVDVDALPKRETRKAVPSTFPPLTGDDSLRSDPDALINELAQQWIDGEWFWSFDPGQTQRVAGGAEQVQLYVQSRFDHRLSQRFIFAKGGLASRELLLLDDPRGVELRVMIPLAANQCAGFVHAPFHRMAEAVLKLRIERPLGVEERITGKRVSELAK